MRIVCVGEQCALQELNREIFLHRTFDSLSLFPLSGSRMDVLERDTSPPSAQERNSACTGETFIIIITVVIIVILVVTILIIIIIIVTFKTTLWQPISFVDLIEKPKFSCKNQKKGISQFIICFEFRIKVLCFMTEGW